MTTALGIAAALVALAWAALAVRLIRLARGPSFRFLGPMGPSPIAFPAVDAIVPARNEEANVAATIAGLLAQDYPSLTIRTIDDQSTDGTAAILERLAAEPGSRLVLIRGSERPKGWVGKTWAVHQGVLGTPSDWLWFVDADMGLHPGALSRAMAEAERTGADLVSFLPGLRCLTFWQGSIASAFLQLLSQLYPLDRVNDPARPEALAAGGFLLIRRAAYDRAGGHEACRRSITEDIQLARNVKAGGGRLAIRLAPGLAWTHMYGSFGEIWRGLRKNAYAGMDYLPHKYATGTIVALALAWAPLLALGVGLASGDRHALAVGGAGVLAQAVATIPILIFLKLPFPFAFTLPVGISAYVAIATSSVWHHHRGRILWKGRILPASMVASSVDPPGTPS